VATWRSSFGGVLGRNKLSTPFLGLPEVRLVGLKNARHTPGLVPHDSRQESVAPSERCAHGHPQLLARCPDGQSFLKALSMLEKLIFGVQVSQRRVRCRIEGLQSIHAAVALHPTTRAVPDVLEAVAVGAPCAGHRLIMGA